MSGTLEKERFYALAKEFIAVSSTLGDSWYMKTVKIGEVEDGYLVKRQIIPCFNQKPEDEDEGKSQSPLEDISESPDMEADESAAELVIPHQEFYTFEYHIIYSESYSVPVLYFNGYHSDGRPLSLEEVWSNVPECYQDQISGNKWSILTQQEHPKLGIPCFMLHPCHTADLMSSALSGVSDPGASAFRSNYLISWLSAVGPLVGLKLSLDYVKHLR